MRCGQFLYATSIDSRRVNMAADTQMDSVVALAFGDIKGELASTRRMIAAVPDGKFAWQPHAKSSTLGGLANHIVQMAGWGRMILTQTEFDFSAPHEQPPKAETTAALLQQLDANTADTLSALAGVSLSDLNVNWDLKYGGNVIFGGPRSSVFRSLYMNHIIHHRAQLSIYLRLLDIPMPGMYGPSADEQ
jgi:uncharacterized damage-inducible protein DinB